MALHDRVLPVSCSARTRLPADALSRAYALAGGGSLGEGGYSYSYSPLPQRPEFNRGFRGYREWAEGMLPGGLPTLPPSAKSAVVPAFVRALPLLSKNPGILEPPFKKADFFETPVLREPRRLQRRVCPRNTQMDTDPEKATGNKAENGFNAKRAKAGRGGLSRARSKGSTRRNANWSLITGHWSLITGRHPSAGLLTARPGLFRTCV